MAGDPVTDVRHQRVVREHLSHVRRLLLLVSLIRIGPRRVSLAFTARLGEIRLEALGADRMRSDERLPEEVVDAGVGRLRSRDSAPPRDSRRPLVWNLSENEQSSP